MTGQDDTARIHARRGVSPRGYGFALIELLVVIALIVILVGMLLPALARAKENAKTIKCVNNEKQIALAFLLYAGDQSDFLPIAGLVFALGVAPSQWTFEISQYVAVATSNALTVVARDKVLTCPTANLEKAIPPSIPGYQAYGGYGHNYGYLRYTAADRKKISRITKPVDTCMNGDGLDPASGLNWWNLGYLYAPNHVPDGSTSGIRPYVRHGKGGNYAWAGGNVSLASWKTMSTGLNGQVNWFYMASPNDPPTVP